MLEARAWSGPFVDAVQGHVEKAREHRKRCSQFVRDVGNEVAPHRVESFLFGHVAGNQDARFAIDINEADFVGRIWCFGSQDVRRGKVAGLDVVSQPFVGNEGKKVATDVVFTLYAEDFFGDIVAPRHRPVGFHKYDAFGQCGKRLAVACFTFGQAPRVLFELSAALGNAVEDFTPDPRTY